MAKAPYEQARDLLVAQGVEDPSDFEIRAVARLLRFEGAAGVEAGEARARKARGFQAVAAWLQRNPVVLLLAVVFDIALVFWVFVILRPEPAAGDFAPRAVEAANPAEGNGPGGTAQTMAPEVVRRLGPPPPRSDGKTPDAVIAYVRGQGATETAEVFEQCDAQYRVTAAGYELRCTYSSENPDGFMIRYEGQFVLRNGTVVSSDIKYIP